MIPLGVKPPCAVRLAKPTAGPGHRPTMQAAQTHRKTTMAATLMEANQYSASPHERTDSRFRTVNTSTSPRVTVQGGMCGNQKLSSLAPATASMATTITQKYQYIQPVKNPASSPSAMRLYS